MKKQKQQVISRFFAPKPKTSDPSPSTSISKSPSPPPPKISATVSFSPAKRLRATQLTSPKKFPKLSHNYENNPDTLLTKPSSNPKLSPHTHNPIPPLPNPTLHEKFLKKLLEPDQRLLKPSTSLQISNPKYTPLEQQVVELKAKYPDVLLMIEVGYKYRFFGEDAENAARVLGIYAHMDHNFLTASVPTFRLNVHVRRLVSSGYKVGVVKQTETAAIKAHGSNKLGPFCRGLSALYTKATLDAGENLGGGEEECGSSSNYLFCVVEKRVEDLERGGDVRVGAVGVEVSTGDVVYGEFNDNFMRAGLEAMVLNLSPAELLLGGPLSKQTEKLLLSYAGPASNVRVEHSSRDCFSNGGALAEVMCLYQKMSGSNLTDVHQGGIEEETDHSHLAIQGVMSMPDLAIQALALTILYLKQFGLERILCLGASFRPFSSNAEMTLSANALQQLEVLKNNSDGLEYGSLLACMNNTLTVFGARLLRHWVSHPLRDQKMICARLDGVSEIAESMGSTKSSLNLDYVGEDTDLTVVQPEIHYLISSVLTTLGRSPDIQRGITRIFHRTATASEFIAVIQAILAAGKQLQLLHVEEETEMTNFQVRTVRSGLLRKLILAASSSSVINAAAKLLSSLNKEAADQRDLHNLFIVSDGKYSEVAEARRKAHFATEKLDLLIGRYRKKLQIRNLEFISVSGVTHLIELPTNVKVPSDWVKVNSTKKTIRYHPPEVLAALDELSLANEELTVVCRAAWDSFLKEFSTHYAEFQAAVQAFAAMDCLHSLAILSRNKVGSFVPASLAKLHVVDGIYTRMGASDSIQQGRSTFLEELSEASHILKNCTNRSLVIIDELGRGTSTHDGVAIAYATLQYLLEQKRCLVLFVTHYPKIAEIKNEFPGSVGAYHVSYLTSEKDTKMDSTESSTNDEDVTYLYKLVPGVSERSFGFKVAQLAQVPSSCIQQAIVMAASLEEAVQNRSKNGLLMNCPAEILSNAEERGTEENVFEVPNCSYGGNVESIEKFAIGFNEFLVNINSAFLEEYDVVERLHFLKHAKSLCVELLKC